MAEYVLHRGDKPLHRQLADQIQKQIVDGQIASGSQLPTVRKMAAASGVSRVTVLQAYELLRIRRLVDTRVGAGTFVCEPSGINSGSSRLKVFRPCSIVADYKETAKAGDIVSFATAYPDDALFQEDDFVVGAIPRNNQEPYVDHMFGDPSLIAALVGHYRALGMMVPQDETLIVGGGAAANAAVASLLGRTGGRFVVQEPLFPYVESYLLRFGATPVGVPKVDGDLDTERLEHYLKAGDIKAIFVELVHDSATGLSASLPNKREVIHLAEKYQVPIIEDISGLWWRHTDDERPATLWEIGADVDIVSFDCFSKTIASSVSIGCLFTGGKLREKLAVNAMGFGSRPPKMLQAALTEYISSRKLAQLMTRASPRYTRRRNALLQALEDKMPEGVTWTIPSAGFSLWLTLPSIVDDKDFYTKSLEAGVALAPGFTFMSPLRPVHSVRLSFGTATENELGQAVTTLAQVIKRIVQTAS